MGKNLRSLLLLATLACTTGCAQAVLAVVLANSGGGGSGGSGGGGSAAPAPAPPAQPFTSSLSVGQASTAGGDFVEVQLPPGGPVLTAPVSPAANAPDTVLLAATGTPSVTVGGVASPQVIVLAADRFRFQLPANPQGNRTSTLAVVITLPGWRSETTLTYRAIAPTLSGLTPTQVPATGGTLVLTGTGFADGSLVQLGGSNLTPSALTPTSITVQVADLPVGELQLSVRHPEGMVTLALTLSVLANGGGGGSSSGFQVTATPTSVTLRPGVPVTLTFDVKRDGEPLASGFLFPELARVGGGTYGASGVGITDGKATATIWTPEAGAHEVRYSLNADPSGSSQGTLPNTVQVQPWNSAVQPGYTLSEIDDAVITAVASTLPKHVYAGGATGVWFSADFGQTWASRPIPGNPDLRALYALSTTFAFAATDAGVYRTNSSGAAWTAPNTGLTSLDIRDLAPGFNVLVVATPDGVFTSVDRASSWSATAALPAAPERVAVASGDNQLYYATVGGEVHKTTNGGTSWSRVDVGFDGSTLSAITCDSTGLVVLAGSVTGRVHRSADGGGTWSTASDPSGRGRPVRDLAHWGSFVLAAVEGQGVFSYRGGSRWEPRNGRLGERDARRLALYDNTNWHVALGRAGVARTDRGGHSSQWEVLETLPLATLGATSIRRPALLADDRSLFAFSESGSDTAPFKSSDGGQSYFPAAGPFGSADLVQVSRARLYATSGWASEDAGATWRRLRRRTGTSLQELDPIAVDSGDGLRLYSDQGYFSTDGGASLGWTLATNGGELGGARYGQAPGLVNRLFASAAGKILRSNDRGASWQQVLASASTYSSLSVDPQNEDRVLGRTSAGVVELSNDGGATWAQVQTSVGSAPRFDRDSGRVYTSTHRSADGGASWTTWSGPGAEAIRSVSLRGGRDDDALLVNTASGLHRSGDQGASWTTLSTSMQVQPPGELFVSPAIGDHWYFTRSGQIYRSTSAGASWQSPNAAPGLDLRLDAADPAKVYAFGGGALQRSDDGGANWITLAAAPAATNMDAFVTDANVGDRIYHDDGTTLRRSDDAGGSWTTVASPGAGHVRVCSPPGHAGLLLSAIGQIPYRSDDAGGAWTALADAQTAAPLQVRVDPTDSNRVFVLSTSESRFRLSLDNGATWQEGAFPRVDDPDLLVSSTLAGRVYARTATYGVLVSSDNGATWSGAGEDGLDDCADLRWAGQEGHLLVRVGRFWLKTASAGQ